MPPPLKKTLQALTVETYEQFNKKFALLSQPEVRNWTRWKTHLENKISKMDEPRPTSLIRKVKKGIKDLKGMNIIAKQSDKNLGLVAIERSLYQRLRDKELAPPSFQHVHAFPHAAIIRRMRNIFKIDEPLINNQKEEMIEFAKQAEEPNNFYIVPKIHKVTLGTRPITAQHSYLLAPLSKALARVLQLQVDKLTEVPQDSKAVMQQLYDLHIEEPCDLVTYDVERLYPSIKIRDAIQTLHREEPIMRRNMSFWTKVLELIMFNNYVQTDSKVFRQMTGTATGTQVAPPFANLYLYHKMKPILKSPRILYQSRYIDDGLLLVKMNTNIKGLIGQLQACTGLKLTFEASHREAVYLDIHIYKGQRYWREKKLDTKVFFKATNKFLFLPATSAHPPAQMKGIIKGEAIRLLRNSSDKTAWLEALNTVFKGLLARGYRGQTIQHEWKKVRYEDRETYIFQNTSKTRPTGIIAKTKFHPRLKTTWRHLTSCFPIRQQLIPRRLGRFTTTQKELIASWPPHLLFKDFNKIGRAIISAKQN